MKELLVLRHAKSDWDSDAAHDHDRPLNRRGLRDAPRVGRFLRRADRLPDRVVTSSALRARDTVEQAARGGEWSCPVDVTEALYEAAVDDVLAVVAACPDEVERLLIAGHEPTSSALVARLTGARVRFPTAAVAAIGLPIDSWTAVDRAAGELLWLVMPKLVGPVVGDD